MKLLSQSDYYENDWRESSSDYEDWYEKPEAKEVLDGYYYPLLLDLLRDGYIDYPDLDELWEESNQNRKTYQRLLEKAIDDAEKIWREETAD